MNIREEEEEELIKIHINTMKGIISAIIPIISVIEDAKRELEVLGIDMNGFYLQQLKVISDRYGIDSKETLVGGAIL